MEKAKSVEGLVQLPQIIISKSLEVIPKTLTLIEVDFVRIISDWRAKNANLEDKDK